MGNLMSLTGIQVQRGWQSRLCSYPALSKDSADCCCCHPNDSTLTSRTSTSSPLLVPTATLVQGLSYRGILNICCHRKRERVLYHLLIQNLIWRSISSVSCHLAMAKVKNKTITLYKLSKTLGIHDGKKARLKRIHSTWFLLLRRQFSILDATAKSKSWLSTCPAPSGDNVPEA